MLGSSFLTVHSHPPPPQRHLVRFYRKPKKNPKPKSILERSAKDAGQPERPGDLSGLRFQDVSGLGILFAGQERYSRVLRALEIPRGCLDESAAFLTSVLRLGQGWFYSSFFVAQLSASRGIHWPGMSIPTVPTVPTVHVALGHEA